MTRPVRPTSMPTHRAVVTLLVTLTLSVTALAGCGSEQVAGRDSPETSTSTTSTTSSTSIEHPGGADEMVLRIDVAGGLVPPPYAFTRQPSLLLLGDGRVLLPDDPDDPGVTVVGARLTGLRVVRADEPQVQRVLELANGHGLLEAPPSYDAAGPEISDAPTTTLTVTADGVTRRHAAYALADETTEVGARAELAAFVAEAIGLFADEPSVAYEPGRLGLRVEPFGGEPDARSTVVGWPSSDVDLAAVAGCTVVPADGLTDALAAADSTTYFRQHDVVFEVAAVALLPGETECRDGF